MSDSDLRERKLFPQSTAAAADYGFGGAGASYWNPGRESDSDGEGGIGGPQGHYTYQDWRDKPFGSNGLDDNEGGVNSANRFSTARGTSMVPTSWGLSPEATKAHARLFQLEGDEGNPYSLTGAATGLTGRAKTAQGQILESQIMSDPSFGTMMQGYQAAKNKKRGGIGGFVTNAVKFELSHLGNAWDKWKQDPERAFLGINTPLESKLWGGITGKDYTPTIDMYGGAPPDSYAKAQAEGIDTGAGGTMHGIARTIASMFAGGQAGQLGTAMGYSAPVTGAATGAAMGAGNTALQGGSGSDILRAGGTGAVTGGIGGYLGSPDASTLQQMGTQAAQGIARTALTGGSGEDYLSSLGNVAIGGAAGLGVDALFGGDSSTGYGGVGDGGIETETISDGYGGPEGAPYNTQTNLSGGGMADDFGAYDYSMDAYTPSYDDSYVAGVGGAPAPEGGGVFDWLKANPGVVKAGAAGLGSIFSGMQQRNAAQDLQAQLQAGFNRSDPFAASRGLAGAQYNQMLTDPSSYMNSPLARLQIDEMNRAARAKQAQLGQTWNIDEQGNVRGSGTGAIDFANQLQTNIAKQYESALQNRANQAGMTMFPSAGIMSQYGAASGAGQGGLESILKGIGQVGTGIFGA